jgi:hypothetical protein
LCRLSARSATRNKAPYDQTFTTVIALLSAASLAAPGVGHAQTFKVEKFDIKGEGGTDYVAVEAVSNSCANIVVSSTSAYCKYASGRFREG